MTDYNPADETHLGTDFNLGSTILLDRFQLEAKLGQGGMGAVYRASDLLRRDKKGNPTQVAIKVISSQLRQDPRAEQLFKEELEKSRSLRHHNIIAVYDLHEDRDLLFISMELLDGYTLDTELKNHPQGLSLERTLELLQPVATALEYAHAHGVIHRDLSPKNIFILKNGEVRLIDFGIAYALNETYFTHNAAAANTAGNDPYMSPERFTGGNKSDVRDDIYGLAVVIYESLTGSRPYQRGAIIQRPENLFPEQPASLTKPQWGALKAGLAFQRQKRTAKPQQLIEAISAKSTGGGAWKVIAGILVVVGVVAGWLQLGGGLPQPEVALNKVIQPAIKQPDLAEQIEQQEAANQQLKEIEKLKQEQDQLAEAKRLAEEAAKQKHALLQKKLEDEKKAKAALEKKIKADQEAKWIAEVERKRLVAEAAQQKKAKQARLAQEQAKKEGAARKSAIAEKSRLAAEAAQRKKVEQERLVQEQAKKDDVARKK